MAGVTSVLSRHPRVRWWPLYLLGMFALAMLAGDWLLPLPEGWRTFLLLPATVLFGLVIWWWVGRNERLLSEEGVDARAKNDPILQALLEQAGGSELGDPL